MENADFRAKCGLFYWILEYLPNKNLPNNQIKNLCFGKK